MDAVEISTNSVKDNGFETIFSIGVRIYANGFLAATDGAVTWCTGVKFATIWTLHWSPVEYCVKTWTKHNHIRKIALVLWMS
jgi:hypothetical protein